MFSKIGNNSHMGKKNKKSYDRKNYSIKKVCRCENLQSSEGKTLRHITEVSVSSGAGCCKE